MRGWNDGDLNRLDELAQRRSQIEREMRTLVSELRQGECPWSVIGEALRVSKQAAQRKYGSVRTSLEDRPLPMSPEDQAYIDKVDARNAAARAKLRDKNQRVELRQRPSD